MPQFVAEKIKFSHQKTKYKFKGLRQNSACIWLDDRWKQKDTSCVSNLFPFTVGKTCDIFRFKVPRFGKLSHENLQEEDCAESLCFRKCLHFSSLLLIPKITAHWHLTTRELLKYFLPGSLQIIPGCTEFVSSPRNHPYCFQVKNIICLKDPRCVCNLILYFIKSKMLSIVRLSGLLF